MNDLDKRIEDIYFEAHTSIVRNWIKQNIVYWKQYGTLPPDIERRCIKLTGYPSHEFAAKAAKIKRERKV